MLSSSTGMVILWTYAKGILHRGRGFGGSYECSRDLSERTGKASCCFLPHARKSGSCSWHSSVSQFLHEAFCVATGQCRISVRRLCAFSEEDANGGGRHCVDASNQHQRSAHGLAANRQG